MAMVWTLVQLSNFTSLVIHIAIIGIGLLSVSADDTQTIEPTVTLDCM